MTDEQNNIQTNNTNANLETNTNLNTESDANINLNIISNNLNANANLIEQAQSDHHSNDPLQEAHSERTDEISNMITNMMGEIQM